MTYTEDQLTGWIDVEKQKPWEHGVYEVMYEYHELSPTYSWWNGEEWGFLSHTAELAKEFGNRCPTRHSVYKWRGLSQNPNAKPKRSGNKRKVMYVVCCQRTRCTQAVFANKENAQEYAEHLNFPVYITKIRFRTPEHD